VIQSAILEKRLIYDNSILSTDIIIHNLTNLKSYYDRQLPNLVSIIEESTSIERAPIKLFTKVLPRFKRYICTGYRISSRYYGRPTDPTGRMGQSMKLSGDTCRDKSYFIIKNIENEDLRVMITSPIINIIEKELCVGFVNDVDFFSKGTDTQDKIISILENYSTLYQATEYNKTSYFC